MQVLEFNTVVIGSGLAGLAAANHSSKYGNVALITKSQLNTSNSYYAQGGIAVALSTDDLPDLHLQDTLVAGRGLCDYDAVEVLVNEGKDRVNELIGDGMQFDKIDGKLVMGLEGGHNKRRILHADGDATGKELTCFLLNIVKQNQEITTFENYAVIKLLQNENCLAGVQIIDVKSGNNVIFKTQSVILATGGLSRIYTRTTNPHIASGDGIALAYNVGARIADLEFVQFHPSALYVPGKNAYLISEAVRGEGAWLLNSKGERFMKDLHPLAELAPRDIVAYSIFKQIQKSKEKYVYLSLKHLNKEKIIKRFKHIYLQLKEYGIDLASDLVPIAPAAHY
ncbi:MAG: FAD-dependent oxidoreductase, partial [Draconibacterium sp.]|nr:FAD-dependent oxidoreductase [Draconibacterium sp.]